MSNIMDVVGEWFSDPVDDGYDDYMEVIRQQDIYRERQFKEVYDVSEKCILRIIDINGVNEINATVHSTTDTSLEFSVTTDNPNFYDYCQIWMNDIQNNIGNMSGYRRKIEVILDNYIYTFNDAWLYRLNIDYRNSQELFDINCSLQYVFVTEEKLDKSYVPLKKQKKVHKILIPEELFRMD